MAPPETLDDSGQIIEGSGKKTLYTPSGVSKWNQCKYEVIQNYPNLSRIFLTCIDLSKLV